MESAKARAFGCFLGKPWKQWGVFMTLASFWNGAKAPLPENGEHATRNKSAFFRRIARPLSRVAVAGMMLAVPVKAVSQDASDRLVVSIRVSFTVAISAPSEYARYEKMLNAPAFHYRATPLSGGVLLKVNLFQIDPNRKKRKSHLNCSFEMAPKLYSHEDYRSSLLSQGPYNCGVSRIAGIYFRPSNHKHAKPPNDAYAPATAQKGFFHKHP